MSKTDKLNASEITSCNFLAEYDYFSCSEVPYIYACFLLGFVSIVVSGVNYGVVKLQNLKRRKMKAHHEENNKRKPTDKMVVKEWLHLNHKQLVKVKFGPEDAFTAFYTVNRKSDKLRKVNFKNIEMLTVESDSGRAQEAACCWCVFRVTTTSSSNSTRTLPGSVSFTSSSRF